MEDNEISVWLKLWGFCNVDYCIDGSDYARFYKGRDVDFYVYPIDYMDGIDLKRKLIDDQIESERRWREEQDELNRLVREARMPRKMTEDDL